MIQQGNKKPSKPEIILEYNKNKGAVDKLDMQISFSETTRKTKKWYKKLFYHILDVSVYNAYILYQSNNKKTLELSEFRLEVIKDLLRKHGTEKLPHGRPHTHMTGRLTERHFSALIPDNKYRKCHVCSNTTRKPQDKTKRTRFECRDCNVGLCIDGCFETFHTLEFF